MRKPQTPPFGTLPTGQLIPFCERRAFLRALAVSFLGTSIIRDAYLRKREARSEAFEPSRAQDEAGPLPRQSQNFDLILAARALLLQRARESLERRIDDPIALLQRNLRLSYSSALQLAVTLEQSGYWSALEGGRRILLSASTV